MRRSTVDTKKGAFADPKPLPGQAGYRQSESATLDKEAKEMEMRLKLLQERMQRQQEADAITGSGSGRWKSARPEKGSIRSYGKDVQERHKKKQTEIESGATSSSGKTRLLKQKTSAVTGASGDFKVVTAWDVADVSAWLSALNLSQYVSAFAQNAIDGSVLLDITLEDLDYMSINALGHRKTILKSVEELRRNNRFVSATAVAAAPAVVRTHSNPALSGSAEEDDGCLTSRSVTKQQTTEVKKTHWSHLEPLSSNTVTHGGNSAVNAADGNDYAPGDILDEAAERRAFQEAVEEWRRSRTPKESDVPDNDLKNAGGGMWQNPFATPSAADGTQPMGLMKGGDLVDEEEAEKAAFRAAVAEWRSGGSEKVSIVREYKNPSDLSARNAPPPRNAVTSSTSSVKEASSTSAQVIAVSGGGGASEGTLLQGALDEEREHQEFVRAVEAWRNRGSTGEAHHSTTANSLADQLSQQLEMEQKMAAERLQQQKRAAEERLRQANEELHRLRAERDISEDSKNDKESAEGDVAVEESKAYSRAASRKSNRRVTGDYAASSAAAAAAISMFTYSTAPVSVTSPQRGADDDFHLQNSTGNSTPNSKQSIDDTASNDDNAKDGRVALVNSVLGSNQSVSTAAAVEQYVVEEVDSD